MPPRDRSLKRASNSVKKEVRDTIYVQTIIELWPITPRDSVQHWRSRKRDLVLTPGELLEHPETQTSISGPHTDNCELQQSSDFSCLLLLARAWPQPHPVFFPYCRRRIRFQWDCSPLLSGKRGSPPLLSRIKLQDSSARSSVVEHFPRTWRAWV